MSCPCCSPRNINDLDNTFDAAQARQDARRYLKKGLDKRARKLIAYLLAHCGKPVSVLDIGCGAGGAHQELLRRGIADRAVGVDASSAYLEAAKANAARLNLSDRVVYEHQDFALTAASFAPAEVVLMDRVICCYPYLAELLGAAAQHAQGYLCLSFPRDEWWTRLPYRLYDLFQALFRSKYRFYLHPYPQIMALAEAAGLRLVHTDRTGLWQILVFARSR
ncbi:MAG: methyltransferase domain-containing protein [Anaerolineales bacterium]|nr:methyltransferase domain-containing protein [Anaerolineales bacterium]